jgi:2'-5' RNA ligase
MRLGVVLLVPPPLAGEIDGLRRGCGDRSRSRVPPHLTLVPPVNVRDVDLPRALQVVRQAAAGCHPLRLRLGPPTSFLPDSPVVYLDVGGDEKELAALHRLRELVFRPPLERRLDHPFVPHVTIADEMSPPERVEATLVALADFVAEVTFHEVHLLQEEHHGPAHRRWVPIADYPFAPVSVVGRGGVALELVVSHLADPEAVRFERGEWPDEEPPDRVVADTPGPARPIVVTARRDGQVVGVARGWCDETHAQLTSVLVAEAQRGQGIGRHLLAAFEHAAGTS